MPSFQPLTKFKHWDHAYTVKNLKAAGVGHSRAVLHNPPGISPYPVTSKLLGLKWLVTNFCCRLLFELASWHLAISYPSLNIPWHPSIGIVSLFYFLAHTIKFRFYESKINFLELGGVLQLQQRWDPATVNVWQDLALSCIPSFYGNCLNRNLRFWLRKLLNSILRQEMCFSETGALLLH